MPPHLLRRQISCLLLCTYVGGQRFGCTPTVDSGTDKWGTGRNCWKFIKSMFCWSWNSWTPGWTKDTKSIGLKVFQTATTNTATWTGQGQVVCVHFLGYRECLLQRRRRFARFPVRGFLQQRGDHRLDWRISGYLFCFLWKRQHPTVGHWLSLNKILKDFERYWKNARSLQNEEFTGNPYENLTARVHERLGFPLLASVMQILTAFAWRMRTPWPSDLFSILVTEMTETPLNKRWS